MNKRICLALDLKNDPDLIRKYEAYHREVWPEILNSIRNGGIEAMEIYRTGNRLFMIMEVDDSFDPEDKAKLDAQNPKVIEWERIMSTMQKPLEWADSDQKWVPMKMIFQLKNE